MCDNNNNNNKIIHIFHTVARIIITLFGGINLIISGGRWIKTENNNGNNTWKSIYRANEICFSEIIDEAGKCS